MKVPNRKLMGAWTPEKYQGQFPPFVNITHVGSMVEITIRAVTKADGGVGDCVSVLMNNHAFQTLIQQAYWKFETGLPEYVDL